MSPTTIALIIGLVEQAIQDAPAIKADLQTIFSKTDPTAADWEALKAKVASQTFESLAPHAKIQ